MRTPRSLLAKIKGIRQEIAEIHSALLRYQGDLWGCDSAGRAMLLRGNIAAQEGALLDARKRLKDALDESKTYRSKG